MDRPHLESAGRLQRPDARMHQLLRHEDGGAPRANGPAALRRPDEILEGRRGLDRYNAPGAGPCPARALTSQEADGLLRQLDVRSFSRERARRMDRPRLRGDGTVAAAYVPGADEAGGPDAGVFCGARPA